MSGDFSANMARGHATYKSGPQGAAVTSPSRTVSSSLSTTHTAAATPSPAAKTSKPASGKRGKEK